MIFNITYSPSIIYSPGPETKLGIPTLSGCHRTSPNDARATTRLYVLRLTASVLCSPADRDGEQLGRRPVRGPGRRGQPPGRPRRALLSGTLAADPRTVRTLLPTLPTASAPAPAAAAPAAAVTAAPAAGTCTGRAAGMLPARASHRSAGGLHADCDSGVCTAPSAGK